MNVTASSRSNPCAICGRTKDGDCRETKDGFWLCHTERDGFRKGQRHANKPFVFCGKSDEAQGFGVWKPEALCTDRPQKTDRKVGTLYFNYQFWDGQPTPAQRYRKDFGDGRPKEVKWCRGGLGGRPQSDVAPYQWFDVSANASPEAPLFIVKGELKAELLTKLGLNAVSILDVSERLISELRRLEDAVVLAPDCDLADLGGWYSELTAALPQARHLLSPMKGMQWRDPPRNGGLGVEDWIVSSKPSQEEISNAITDAPWASKQAAVDLESADQRTIKQLQTVAQQLLQEKTPPHERMMLLRSAANTQGLAVRDGEMMSLMANARRKLQGQSDGISPDDEFELSDDEWLCEGLLVRQAPNLITALQKVGKSAFVAGLLSRWHYGNSGEFLGHQLHGPCPPVIIAGTDMALSDWKKLLAPVGLMTQRSNGKWGLAPDGPIKKLWHRGDPIYLDIAGCELIAQQCEQHQGAVVWCDTIAALVATLGLDEAKPEICEPIYNLQEVIDPFGATAVYVHHSSKSRAGERASNASRNSNALPAAMSQIIQLHWLNADSNADQRITLSTEGRNGTPLEEVIEQVERSQWIRHGDAADLRQQQQREKAEQNLTERQALALDVVRDIWDREQMECTAQALYEVDQSGYGSERQARRTLDQLSDKRLLESRTTASQEHRGSSKRFRPHGAELSLARGGASEECPQCPQCPPTPNAGQRFEVRPLWSEDSAGRSEDTKDTVFTSPREECPQSVPATRSHSPIATDDDPHWPQRAA